MTTDTAQIVPYVVNEDGNLRSFLRGAKGIASLDTGRFDSISQIFVDIITSQYDQDVSILGVGAKGSGKSSAFLSVAYWCAQKVAAWKNDGSKWDEYYNLEEYTAVILEEEATRLMNIQEKYIIKNFDDIGIGWGARNFRDQENIDKNDIFQINRTDNTIQLFSVPNQFLIDKVPRSLVSHYIEMDQRFFEHGHTTLKLFKPRTLFREGKIITPFLQVDRNKFVNYLIPSPPHDLWTQYKELRRKSKDIAIHRRQENKQRAKEMLEQEIRVKADKLRRAEDKLNSAQKENTIESRRADWKKWFEDNVTVITDRIVSDGITAEKAFSKVARESGLTTSAVSYIRREGFIKKYNLDKISRS